MPESKGGDVSVSLTWNRSGEWFVLQIDLEGGFFLQMIPNPGYPRSVISPTARNELIHHELVPPVKADSYRLHHLTIQGQAIPDIDVVVRPAISRLFKVDGILGFDFFQSYAEIRFDTAAHRLTLIDP